jgi:DNA-binding transcriptional LysR family regulator
MELRQLEYFVAVAEEANFTRAARRAHVSQPGISAQVRQLERELGQALFDRSGRSVKLTEAGAAVLPYALAALGAAAGARLVVEELAGLVRGQVRVGMVSGCALPVFAELLAGYHNAHPGVSIAVSEAGSDCLVESLQAGELDLALIGAAGGTIPGLESLVVVEEPLVAAVSRDHPLSGHRSISLGSLAEHQLICLPVGTGVRAALDAACARGGFTPRVVSEASALPMVARLAEMGLGVAVVPASTARPGGLALHVLDITRPKVRSRLELAWGPASVKSPAARVLAQHAREFLHHLGADRQPAA